MHYVYLLQSEAFPGQRYVGLTSDLRRRLAEHNAGKSPHTSKYVPWRLVLTSLSLTRKRQKSSNAI
jgi:predicted GIY-YIG superfamily endonuclease